MLDTLFQGFRRHHFFKYSAECIQAKDFVGLSRGYQYACWLAMIAGFTILGTKVAVTRRCV